MYSQVDITACILLRRRTFSVSSSDRSFLRVDSASSEPALLFKAGKRADLLEAALTQHCFSVGFMSNLHELHSTC